MIQTSVDHTTLAPYVLRTLLYFDIFNYPLTPGEVFKYLGTKSVAIAEVENCLLDLTDQNTIYRLGKFFSIQPDYTLRQRRIAGNQLATRYLPLAEKQARLIAGFPFVRAVLVSGSLSKGYMDSSCDIDFFIITARKRLWICRTILVLYKRIFLGNSHKHFCVNYFLDEDHLEIEEKNLFTATELATVIPLTGGDYYKKLMTVNKWLTNWFPNFEAPDAAHVSDPPGRLKSLCEKMLNLVGARWWEWIWMRLTFHRWIRLYRKKYSEKEFRIAFKTTPYASKNHPRNFQRLVMDQYNQKINRFKESRE